eukprot:5906780-Pyramimonas_sp.AAC.1
MEAAAQWFYAAEAELVKLHELGQATGVRRQVVGLQGSEGPSAGGLGSGSQPALLAPHAELACCQEAGDALHASGQRP